MVGFSEIRQPLFSIIIPSKNESTDISATLDACLALSEWPAEIIVVDDSTDNTPEIVSKYASKGVRLIHRMINENGCCGARNAGMKEARGQIIVLMNADDRPRSDFLSQIKKHYDEGVDYLIVKSVVLNKDNLWGKYIWTGALAYLATNPDMEWSEGFSCRRDAAQNVGYIPGDFPVKFCRDYMLGVSLKKAGYKKETDLRIEMEHVAPHDSASFWSNRVWRGTFTAPFSFYISKSPIIFIIVKIFLKTAYTFLRYLLIIPFVLRAIMLAKYTPDGWKSIPGLIWVGAVQDCAFVLGGLKGLVALIRKEILRRA